MEANVTHTNLVSFDPEYSRVDSFRHLTSLRRYTLGMEKPEPLPKKSDESLKSDTAQEPAVTDESLMAELNAYAEALRQEFAESQAHDTPADVETHTRDFFKKNVQDAALQVVWLAHNSDSDSVRLRASQFIIKEAFDEAVREGDPIKDLMRELTKSPSPAPANPNE